MERARVGALLHVSRGNFAPVATILAACFHRSFVRRYASGTYLGQSAAQWAGQLRISLTEKIEPVRMVLGTPHIDSARPLYGIKVTGELKNTAR
jgi:hypothetical protein